MERAGLTRLHSLDYLRGLMALAILIFHFEKWTTGVWQANSLSGKLGVYAVSVFFIISGMALAHTYSFRLHARTGAWKAFLRKRIFRIFPLLWLATAATLLLDEVQRPWTQILLNFSGMFGFVDASKDIATGAWSIGCELTYYALFPLLLWLGENRKSRFLALWMLLTAVGLGRGFVWPFYAENTDQAVWWPSYTQAIYHLWFFMSGMALSIFQPVLRTLPMYYWKGVLGVGVAAFVWKSIGNHPVELVWGFNRVELSLFTLMIAAGWCLGFGRFQGISHRVFAWLGGVSYSLYLLHPLVYRVCKAANVRWFDAPVEYLLAAAVLLSLLISHLSYQWLEKPAMRLGN